MGCREAGQEPPPGPTPPGPLSGALVPPLGRKREAKERDHEPRDLGVEKEPEEDQGSALFLPTGSLIRGFGAEGLPPNKA